MIPLLRLAVWCTALVPAAAAWAESPPRFGLPVDCGTQTPCVLQNYVDAAPGPEARDFTCGPLTYDRHTGVDIRVPTYLEMRAGVPVVAAAPGVVTRARDGAPDKAVEASDPQALRDEAAGGAALAAHGNEVVLDHGGGWQSQYSHLRNGSVAVRPGERVAAGQRLGLIGSSGKAAFPHVHFAVIENHRTLDPFSGLPPESGCGAEGAPLWSEAARAALAYRAGGLLAAGFTDRAPDMNGLLEGVHRSESVAADGPALVFWVLAWGLRKGDVETIRILGPGGAVVAAGDFALARDMAQWVRFTGQRNEGRPFPTGRYRGEYIVERGRGAEATRVIEVRRDIEVR